MASHNQAPSAGASRVAPVLPCLLLGLCLTLLPGPLRAAPPADLPALTALEAKGAATAGLIVDLERGKVLAAHAPDRALIPASVVKLATAGRALEAWGPGWRFTTSLLRRGALKEGTLSGDLVLRGGGDASITDEDLWRMARSLAQRGLKEVTGGVIVDEGLFGRIACNVADRCDAEARSENAYDAPLSATPVDYNSLALTVVADAEEGQAAQLLLEPYDLPDVAVEGSVTTADGPTQLSLERVSQGAQNNLLVSGSLPPGKTLTLYRSLAEPAHYAGTLFRAFLEQAGIRIDGAVAVSEQPVAGAEPLLDYQGAELARAIDLMLTYSNNLQADTLALDLQRRLQPDQPPSLAAAGRLLEAHVAGAADGSAFPAPAGAPAPRLADGSGLDPADRLTARQLVQLLEQGYRRTETFPSLLGALTVPANGPQTTLPAPGGAGASAADGNWNRRIMVKTGGLGVPVSVTSLAGYFRFKDGGWGAFAFLVNGAPDRPISRADAFSAMRRDLSRHWKR
ncbi:D-alanyl-D-alanine carboxypeptidase / D-alanyl-D-alanine-endopeptidase (penicillin-binding protein 4) [Tistlia consotensis]|uniref:D-alanyl-D-alanine carboxypeptidase / D-alanyl-D-alanine-endopeptidase (Penicillin-binding protein 4) n=1 Tax=Tistlia consotensis USBA 355 TaxID=560819 RepID=A0A1Y6CUL5_9PROT|nr:D-alanyl-D-alanine carboxypeptidase/D-alanyl-D-alanine-endopeptidase [Tistlia consotensis]SMF79130.1 D-alanyl-D-alanine carboxypeptidase / D-alanyl-D-alanine-endopeptidase (penicillin-binding protein 4) [Tistlia consotensis USBA 355]SNS15900.1 D-alanyl-D-alanine carboxypeptidase / D-alanyl-D-alanine-endopeptidase (penicillin-binding protein 4) [Tistlia consotensis]